MATDLFEMMEYSWGWYYKHGFYNEQCYVVLSDYSYQAEKYVKEEGVEECKETEPILDKAISLLEHLRFLMNHFCRSSLEFFFYYW